MLLELLEVLAAAFVVCSSVFFFFLVAPALLSALGDDRTKFIPAMMQLTKKVYFRFVPPCSLIALLLAVYSHGAFGAGLGSGVRGLFLLIVAGDGRLLGALISALAAGVNRYVVAPRALRAGARAMKLRRSGRGDNSFDNAHRDFAIDGGDKVETRAMHQTVVVFVLLAVAGSLLQLSTLVGSEAAVWQDAQSNATSLYQLGSVEFPFDGHGEDLPRLNPEHQRTVALGDKGEAVDFSKQPWTGGVSLIVNVASQWGVTALEYRELSALRQELVTARGEKNLPNDFEILAFPSNEFLVQEPGDSAEIAKFAHDHGAADWIFFEKTRVLDGRNMCDGISPVYRFLKRMLPGEISWNFNKFLVGRDGAPVKRYVTADGHVQLRADIEALLDAPKVER